MSRVLCLCPLYGYNDRSWWGGGLHQRNWEPKEMEPKRLTTAKTNDRVREEGTVLATEEIGWMLALILPGYI